MKPALSYKKFLIIAVAFLFCAGGLLAQKEAERHKPFKDTVDSAFDISYYLYNLHGFLPVPSIITEPAVGYGGILAGAFFIPKKNGKTAKFNMPDIVGLGGGYTENNTWFTGGGYFGFWKDDHIRYRGVTGYADVKLKYYGRGDGFLDEHPAEFTIRAFGFVQQAIFRLGESRLYAWGQICFYKNKSYRFRREQVALGRAKGV